MGRQQLGFWSGIEFVGGLKVWRGRVGVPNSDRFRERQFWTMTGARRWVREEKETYLALREAQKAVHERDKRA